VIIGNGQIATIFKNDKDQAKYKDFCIFASGVSNSNCKDEKEFKREETLLLKSLAEHKQKKLIYFSSCALSAPDYPKNDYYRHKEKMEVIIKDSSADYLICRVPQMFGDLKNHSTLINFIYSSIVNCNDFTVYSGAYRYLIDIDDLKRIVDYIIQNPEMKYFTIDVGNYRKYSVEEIVKIIESLTGKVAHYKLEFKADEYELKFNVLKDLLSDIDIGVNFSSKYLEEKLSQRLNKIGA